MFFNSEGRKIVLYLLYWVFHNLFIIINGIHTIAKDEFWTIIGFCKEYFTFDSNEVLQRTVINVTINSFLCCYAHYTNWRRFNGYVQGNNWFPKINKLDRVYSWFSKKKLLLKSEHLYGNLFSTYYPICSQWINHNEIPINIGQKQGI